MPSLRRCMPGWRGLRGDAERRARRYSGEHAGEGSASCRNARRRICRSCSSLSAPGALDRTQKPLEFGDHEGIAMKWKLLTAIAATALACNALAADKIRVGFISTLSGPSAALGVDIRD